MAIVKRRDLFRSVGAVTALSFFPGDAHAAWDRILIGHRAADGLTDTQLRLVGAIADAIIPRTDTPGATDVGVTDWVNLIVTEYYNDNERTPFLSGLDAIDTLSIQTEGTRFAELSTAAKDRMMTLLDSPADRKAPPVQAYARLKGLVVHGYFTSRTVQQDVLRTAIMPGRFDGAAPMQIKRRGS
jgi:hypothetical protein